MAEYSKLSRDSPRRRSIAVAFTKFDTLFAWDTNVEEVPIPLPPIPLQIEARATVAENDPRLILMEVSDIMPSGKTEDRLAMVRRLEFPKELARMQSAEHFLADEVFRDLISYLRSEADKLQIVAISPFIELPDGQKYGFAKLFEAILP